MKASVLLLFCAVYTVPLVAQEPTIDWIRTADVFSKAGTWVDVDDADNAYVTSHDGSIWLRKYDPTGTELWEVQDTTAIQFNYLYPARVHVDPMGDPVVVGYRYTSPSEGHNANALVLLKYDAAGALQYELIIPGTYSFFNNSSYRTKVTSQMDAAGNVYIGTAGHVTGYPDTGFNAIKITPAGTIAWVSTRTFGNTFYFVNNIRLKEDRLGLAGTTQYWNANATTWVLDTAGTSVWDDVSSGIGGKDIAFDDDLSAYVLTTTDTFPSDLALYQFDAAGAAGWTETYDLGQSDLASRIEYTPDGDLAIMAYGNTMGNLYSDWLTLKVDPSGDLLWSQRYDEHTNNDEVPGMMQVDAAGNIYITGIAGPFPGGSNLGARQLATVKYAANGALAWATAMDTLSEYLSGVGLALDSQSGLYVLGGVQSILIHYLDDVSVQVTEEAMGSDMQVWQQGSALVISTLDVAPGASLQVFDATGRVVFEGSSSRPSDRMEVEGLVSGVFTILLTRKDGNVTVRRISLVH